MSKEYPCVYFDHEKCTLHGTEPENIDWCVMGPCGSETPSNGDHVRDMTDEELAQKFADLQLCAAIKDLGDTGIAGEIKRSIKGEIERAWLRWMKQPYKEAT